jgi:hypothetical protein
MKNNRGIANIILIIIGFILIGILVGYFKKNNFFFQPINLGLDQNNLEDNTAEQKYQCGLVVLEPNLQGEPFLFPLDITGYVNGCGWNVVNGVAGSVQVFDGNGLPISNRVPLTIISESNLLNQPNVFRTNINLTNNPTLRQGIIIFEASPQNGLAPGSFKMPIIFGQNSYAF